MWTRREVKYLQPSVYTRRSSTYVDREFQLKYTKYIVGMALISSLVFLLPAFIFANQNYSIFSRLADLLSPQIADYISKERLLLNVMFAVSFAANLIFWTIFSRKMTGKIAAPAKLLRNHIRMLSRGDLTLTPLKVRENDEFKDLINSYNYLFILLKAEQRHEIRDLLKIKSAIKNPQALEVINNMIEERQLRLKEDPDLIIPSSSEGRVASHGSSRVS